MGEKEQDKPKEEKPKEDKKENKPKKEENNGPITAIFKVDLHCEGCAKKVRRCAITFQGVEKATADMGAGKLTVLGKMDPWNLRERLEVKTHKKVTLVSPSDPPKKNPKKEEPNKDEKKADKPKEVAVALKILLHCDGCVQKIRRTVLRFKGVEGVKVEVNKDVVNVKGIMDVKALVPYLREKLRRDVEVVAPKEEKKGGGEKEKEKEKKKEEGGGGGEKNSNKSKEAKVDVSKMEHHFNYGGLGGGYYYPQMMHAPQLFSDENPNACIVM